MGREKRMDLTFLHPSISYTHLYFRGSGGGVERLTLGYTQDSSPVNHNSLSCQSPFGTPFPSVEMCWMETCLFSEVSFDNDWNLSALWPSTRRAEPQLQSVSFFFSLKVSFLSLFFCLSGHIVLHCTFFIACLSLCLLLSIKLGYFTFWVELFSPKSNSSPGLIAWEQKRHRQYYNRHRQNRNIICYNCLYCSYCHPLAKELHVWVRMETD